MVCRRSGCGMKEEWLWNVGGGVWYSMRSGCGI